MSNPTAEMLRTIRLKIYEDLQQGKLRPDVALRDLQRYASIAARMNDTILEGQMYDMAGIVCKYCGRLHDAEQYFQQAAMLFQESPNHLGRNMNNLAEIYLQLGQYRKAVNSY